MKSLPESNYKWNLLTLITRNWCRFSTGIMDTSIMRRWVEETNSLWITIAGDGVTFRIWHGWPILKWEKVGSKVVHYVELGRTTKHDV
jgi:hypothetical protein